MKLTNKAYFYRESYRARNAEKSRTYKTNLFSENSDVFGSKKVIFIGEDSSTSENEDDIVHNYVHCGRSYIQVPNNVSIIKNNNIHSH